MNRTLTKLMTAAATVASTAFLASTVGISTADAATFVLTGSAADWFAETWTLESPEAASVAELFGQIEEHGNGVEGQSGWSAWYGETRLELRGAIGPRGRPIGGLMRFEAESGDGSSGVLMDASSGGYIRGVKQPPVVFVGASGFPFGFGLVWSREDDWVVSRSSEAVPEPRSAIALGMVGAGLVASRLRRRSK